MASEWIDRYVYAVGKEFSEPQRTDIEKEIRGLIVDMLDSRNAGGNEASEEAIKAVLTELGNPRLLADKYRDQKRYLIGPELYPSYITILKLVGGALSIAMVVLFVIQTLTTPEAILKVFISTLTTYFAALLQGFAWVTVGFGITERVKPANAAIDLEDAQGWSLNNLPELPEQKNRISRIEPIWGITFLLIFGILLTFGIHLLGVWFITDARPFMVLPVFDVAVFRGYLPYIWATILFDLVLEIAKYHFGRWTVRLSVAEILNHAFHLAIGVFIFSNSQIWNPDFMAQIAQVGVFSTDSEAYTSVQPVWNWFTGYTTYLIVLIYGLNMLLDGIKIFKMVRRTE